MKCPKCKKTNVHPVGVGKKYSATKGVVGATIGGIATGGVGVFIGLAVGLNGKKGKVDWACLDCGKSFKK